MSIGLAKSQVPGTNRVKVPPGLIGKPTETEIYTPTLYVLTKSVVQLLVVVISFSPASLLPL
jgi:hypothetical protein